MLKACLLLLSVSLSALELFIPRIPLLPWLKPGLANIVTVAWIVLYGPRDAFLYVLLRSWLVGFYFGFSFLSLLLGTAGSFCAVAGMGLVWHTVGSRGLAGMFGMGVVGAMCHNLGQLGVAYTVLAHNVRLLYQIPTMTVASIGFGGTVGLLAIPLLRRTREEALSSHRLPPAMQAPSRKTRMWLCAVVLAWSIVTMALGSWTAIWGSALAATVFVQLILRGSLSALHRPLTGSWLLILAVAATHVFLAHGKTVAGISWLTYEGLEAARGQAVRLWTWLQLSQLLRPAGFDRVMLGVLSRAFGRHQDTLAAAMLALEHFPDMLRRARALSAVFLRTLVRKPRQAMGSLVRSFYGEVMAMVVPEPKQADTEAQT